MYTISKGPSKIVTKSRRGFSQNYEKIDQLRVRSKKGGEEDALEKNNLPRPIFQPVKRVGLPGKQDVQSLTPQHEEMIKYINDSWNIILAVNPYDSQQSLHQDDCNNNFGSNSNSSAINFARDNNTGSDINNAYCIEPPSPILNDFKPFDLESWWGRRLFNNITKNL